MAPSARIVASARPPKEIKGNFLNASQLGNIGNICAKAGFLAKTLIFRQASLTVLSDGVMTGRTLPSVDLQRSQGVLEFVDR
jgi:hypothetical protein